MPEKRVRFVLPTPDKAGHSTHRNMPTATAPSLPMHGKILAATTPSRRTDRQKLTGTSQVVIPAASTPNRHTHRGTTVSTKPTHRLQGQSGYTHTMITSTQEPSSDPILVFMFILVFTCVIVVTLVLTLF